MVLQADTAAEKLRKRDTTGFAKVVLAERDELKAEVKRLREEMNAIVCDPSAPVMSLCRDIAMTGEPCTYHRIHIQLLEEHDRRQQVETEVEQLKREAEQDHAFITALVLGEAPDNIAAMNSSPHYESYWRAIGIIVDQDTEEKP